jgi:hypothetical protein
LNNDPLSTSERERKFIKRVVVFGLVVIAGLVVILYISAFQDEQNRTNAMATARDANPPAPNADNGGVTNLLTPSAVFSGTNGFLK